MRGLEELAAEETALRSEDVGRLHLLLADWQIIADLAFADLVLWLPARDGRGFWAAAQMRPTTAPTVRQDDPSDTFVTHRQLRCLRQAYRSGRVARESEPTWQGTSVRVEAIPVRHRNQVIAVVTRETNLLGLRTPSQLELAYLQTAGELVSMIAHGNFPFEGRLTEPAYSPRVGDGFIRVDATGRVIYASPNAQSVFRRLGLSGDLYEAELAQVARRLVPASQRPDEETLSAVLTGRMPRSTELDNGAAVVILRAIPLRPGPGHSGGIVLARDVTELRRRDRELLTKDVTIREIHHRVKNNLQTVAALLRMQSRRAAPGEGREALEEAVRRVGSIAVVHDLLSRSLQESVDFDDVADRLIASMAEVTGNAAVHFDREGSLGEVSSGVATTLAMALTELLQNALEHGFGALAEGTAPGRVEVALERSASSLRMRVRDDGAGLPAGFDEGESSSLGLTIVRELVADVGGRLAVASRSPRGTEARVELPA